MQLALLLLGPLVVLIFRKPFALQAGKWALKRDNNPVLPSRVLKLESKLCVSSSDLLLHLVSFSANPKKTIYSWFAVNQHLISNISSQARLLNDQYPSNHRPAGAISLLKMNINEALHSDPLLSTFKRLTTQQIVKSREVCRQWLELIDEYPVFWRVLNYCGPPSETQSILDQFNLRSRSTLSEISITLKQSISPQYLFQLNQSILESRQTLRTFLFKSEATSHFAERSLAHSLLPKVAVVDFRAQVDDEEVLVQLSTTMLARSGSHQVLWLSELWNLPSSHPTLFHALTSLRVGGSFYSHGHWRQVLEGFSTSVKHLDIGMDPQLERGEVISPLEFPKLEVLELLDVVDVFPGWMIFPPTLKLFVTDLFDVLPPVFELRVNRIGSLESLARCCPEIDQKKPWWQFYWRKQRMHT